jgi:hypothetical protein
MPFPGMKRTQKVKKTCEHLFDDLVGDFWVSAGCGRRDQGRRGLGVNLAIWKLQNHSHLTLI